MFGVLIVERPLNIQQDETSLNAHRSSLNKNIFFLAAYSGLLAGRNDWSWFVPPVVDAQQPDGVFKTREAEISAINKEIAEIENDEKTLHLRKEVARCREEERLEVSRFKAMMEKSKEIRDLRRMQRNIEPTVAAELIRESQFQKAELRRLQKAHGERVARAEEALRGIEEHIEMLRNRRREMSDELQRWLFSQYRMLNARGEEKDLVDTCCRWRLLCSKTIAICLSEPFATVMHGRVLVGKVATGGDTSPLGVLPIVSQSLSAHPDMDDAGT